MRALLLLFVILFVNTSFSQNYRFNEFGIENGISQNFIYSIEQDAKGYLWVGTGEGLCRYNGREFSTFTKSDGIAEDIVTSSFINKNQEKWFGHNGGQLTLRKNGKFKIYKNSSIISTITGIDGIEEEMLFISQNEGVFSLKNDQITSIGKFGATSFHSIKFIDQTNAAIGTSTGLIHLGKRNGKWKKIGHYLSGQFITAINKGKSNRSLFIGTQDGLLTQLKLSRDKLILRQWNIEHLGEIVIQSIIQDANSNVWVGTLGNGLIKLPPRSQDGSSHNVIVYNTETGLKSDEIQHVFQDREGSVWIGTFGAGLTSIADGFFTFYTHEQDDVVSDVHSIYVDDNYRWQGMENGLLRSSLSGDEDDVFFDNSNGFTKDRVTSLYPANGSLYIGTQNNGLYVIKDSTDKVRKIDWGLGNLANIINQIDGNSDFLWIATQGGLISFDLATSETEIYGTHNGLSHNAILSVKIDHNGDIWLGTFSRYLYKISDQGIEQIEIVNSGQLEMRCITEDFQNNLWIGTAESGVFKLSGESIEHFSALNGLKSNYIYSLQNDVNNNMWVGHRGALSKIIEEDNSITTYNHDFGIQGQVNRNAMTLDKNYMLWIGTENGAIEYNASKDKKNTTPPIISLIRVWVGDESYSPDEDIHLPFGKYRIQFEYIGISFKNSDQITYQFKLNGHDQVFSDPTQQIMATYGRISDGTYNFQVNAFNGNGISNESPATVNISVSKPFWKQIWFIILAFLLLMMLLYAFIRYRTNRLKKTQELLEKELAVKTKEVVEKANKIHEINKDLTDSINYAESIQQSMLSDVDVLTAALPNSFVFFKPRDVVSGDYYFIEKIDNKLIVVCADCTGHGVPGAFVSMVGSVTLRNIYATATWKWKTPDIVLEELDEQVKKILHRTVKAEDGTTFTASDGMDLTVVEINLDTNEILLASASRNSLIEMDGVIEKIKGDSRSIGGSIHLDKKFTLHNYQMNKGDRLYLFTDGVPDQFGGTRDKKLMNSGVKEIVAGLRNLDEEQYAQSVESNFLLWMSDTTQIDDVLFIGLIF